METSTWMPEITLDFSYVSIPTDRVKSKSTDIYLK